MLNLDKVYAVPAYILYRNDIIGETEVMNARTLPMVDIPNSNGFIPTEIDEIADIVMRGYNHGLYP